MSVPEAKRRQGKLEVLIKAEAVAVYTIKILANKNKFDPRYDAWLGNDINLTAKAIFENCRIANSLRVVKPVTQDIDLDAKEARRKLQTQAIMECEKLLTNIDLAYGVYHLSAKRVLYWKKITKEAKSYIKKWRDADTKRYDSS